MCKLGAEKGYRFVGTQRYGFNAFFVRQDLARDTLPTARPEDSLRHPGVQHGLAGLAEVKDRAWVRV